jgi:hypothetical protein
MNALVCLCKPAILQVLDIECRAAWFSQIKPGSVENGIFSGLDWFPTLCAAVTTGGMRCIATV